MPRSMSHGSEGGVWDASAVPGRGAAAATITEKPGKATVRLREAELPVDLESIKKASFVSLEADPWVRELVARARSQSLVRPDRIAAAREALKSGLLESREACSEAAKAMLAGDSADQVDLPVR